MAEKVILDVDTGSDDAVAEMAAILSEDLEVVAICTTWGNLDIELTTENTLRLVEKMGVDIPVYKGCHTAMVKYLCENRIPPKYRPIIVDGQEMQIHEPELKLPPAQIKVRDQHAVLFYIDYLTNAAEPVTLIPVGPITNLGHALRIAPGIVKNIKKIVIMGGGDHAANAGLCGEGNSWHDPEAAQIVLDSGADIIWIPLDATHSACIDIHDCARLRKMNTFSGNFAADLIEHRIKCHNATQPLKVPNAAAVHDALAVCAVIDESVLTDCRPVHMKMGFFDYGEGETIIDRRERPEPPNCRFAYDADRKKFVEMLCGLFEKDKNDG